MSIKQNKIDTKIYLTGYSVFKLKYTRIKMITFPEHFFGNDVSGDVAKMQCKNNTFRFWKATTSIVSLGKVINICPLKLHLKLFQSVYFSF